MPTAMASRTGTLVSVSYHDMIVEEGLEYTTPVRRVYLAHIGSESIVRHWTGCASHQVSA